MSDFQSRSYLQQSQYRNSDNLAARAELHRRFTVSQVEWNSWVLVQLALQPGESVLECGAGPGWLWSSSDALPDDAWLTLTDLSVGMMAEAAVRLAGQSDWVTFATADIQTLPFPSHTFDIVIANHMLYHVPDIARAMDEVTRVLKPNGRFVAATNGRGHMRELFELGQSLFPGMPNDLRIAMRSLPFSLENGESLIRPFFGQVDKRLFDAWLEVDDAAVLVDYMLSSAESAAYVSPDRRQAVVNQIHLSLAASGPFHISKETGMFVARIPTGGA